MPLHDLGYRNWTGQQTAAVTRFHVIAETGVRRAWQSSWLRRLLLGSWLPMLGVGVTFFLFEQSILMGDARRGVAQFIDFNTSAGAAVSDALNVDVNDPVSLARTRHQVWSYLLNFYFCYPQATIMVMVVGLIAPPLISQDVRSRAFLLYFSRPLSRTKYILGKASTVFAYLAAISAAPAIVLYLFGIMLSPDLTVIQHTWDLPMRIVLASLILMIPTTAVALMFSSMTQESRYAAFAWFAFWILGWVTYLTLTSVEAIGATDPTNVMKRWELISPYHTIIRVQSWAFGLSDWATVQSAAISLVIVTFVSLSILYRKVSSPLRA